MTRRSGLLLRFPVLLAAALFFLLPAAGCRQRTPELPPLAADAVVLAFGDSLTFGTGADPGESYPARLQQQLGRTVVNAGIPGEVTAEGLARLPGLLELYRPALVVLCHGGNDLLRRSDEEKAAANLREMVRLAREQGAWVVLLGVPEPGIFLSPPGFYADVAREFSLPFDAETLPDILGDNALKSDPIHPNARGYAQMADAVADLLRRTGAI